MKSIRRLGLAALLALSGQAALAADLGPPVYKSAPSEPIAVPLFNWTGFYVGVNGGYGWGKSNWTGGAGDFTVSPNGFMLGGTAGYNLQTGTFVWGLEGDIDYVDFNGTAANLACGTCTIKDTWLGTFRGRLGIAMNRWLPYITGGGNVVPQEDFSIGRKPTLREKRRSESLPSGRLRPAKAVRGERHWMS